MIKRKNLVKGIRNWTRTEVSIFLIQKWWCLSKWHHNNFIAFSGCKGRCAFVACLEPLDPLAI
jgi:hypothetical protein